MIKIGIHGSTGRVGKLLIENLKNDKELTISVLHAIEEFTFTVPEDVLVTNDVKTLLDNSDVVIDFTLPIGTQTLLETALNECAKPLVIGTTGLSIHQHNLMKEVSKKVPVMYSTNMSLGVAVLNKLVQIASSTLSDFRNGNIGERSKDEIAIMALRGGDVVGRHTVGFYNDGEFVELNHTATSRDTFAKGAIRAAKWIANKEPELYDINDCLGL